MIEALLFALLAVSAFAVHLFARLKVTREELTAAEQNVTFYCDLYYANSRIRTIESIRREGRVSYWTVDALTQVDVRGDVP